MIVPDLVSKVKESGIRFRNIYNQKIFMIIQAHQILKMWGNYFRLIHLLRTSGNQLI